jgi:hypothetical protein
VTKIGGDFRQVKRQPQQPLLVPFNVDHCVREVTACLLLRRVSSRPPITDGVRKHEVSGVGAQIRHTEICEPGGALIMCLELRNHGAEMIDQVRSRVSGNVGERRDADDVTPQ